jgi:hypothetical protein
MQKYCDNADTDSAGSPASADHVVESAPLQMPVDLRLDYSVDFNMTPDLDKDQKLVKQEYISYVAQVSSVGMDILKFWEVCRTWRMSNACEQSLMGLCRSIVAPSQLSSQWPWTFSLSRLHPSHVNGCFLPVPKPIPNDEIA